MPLYSYACAACGQEFEVLVQAGEAASCPECGSGDLGRLLALTAPDAKTPGLLKAGRRRAAKEGHFTNYSRAERSKI